MVVVSAKFLSQFSELPVQLLSVQLLIWQM